MNEHFDAVRVEPCYGGGPATPWSHWGTASVPRQSGWGHRVGSMRGGIEHERDLRGAAAVSTGGRSGRAAHGHGRRVLRAPRDHLGLHGGVRPGPRVVLLRATRPGPVRHDAGADHQAAAAGDPAAPQRMAAGPPGPGRRPEPRPAAAVRRRRPGTGAHLRARRRPAARPPGQPRQGTRAHRAGAVPGPDLLGDDRGGGRAVEPARLRPGRQPWLGPRLLADHVQRQAGLLQRRDRPGDAVSADVVVLRARGHPVARGPADRRGAGPRVGQRRRPAGLRLAQRGRRGRAELHVRGADHLPDAVLAAQQRVSAHLPRRHPHLLLHHHQHGPEPRRPVDRDVLPRVRPPAVPLPGPVRLRQARRRPRAELRARPLLRDVVGQPPRRRPGTGRALCLPPRPGPAGRTRW